MPSIESLVRCGQALPVLTRPSTPVQPGDGSFHNPALGYHNEPVRVGLQLEQDWVPAEQARGEHHAAIAILNVGSICGSLHQQALRIDQDVPLLAHDLFAANEARLPSGLPPTPLSPGTVRREYEATRRRCRHTAPGKSRNRRCFALTCLWGSYAIGSPCSGAT